MIKLLNRRNTFILFLVVAGSYGNYGLSQSNIPSGGQVPVPVVAPVARPIAYPAGALVNYVRTWEPQIGITDEAIVAGSADVTQVRHTTQYTDGLGRPLQTVGWQISPMKTDIVSPVVYDAFGREQYSYLPYTSASNTGLLKTDPFGEQNTFYNNTYPAEQPAFLNEKFYYSHTNYEASPLNRVTKTFTPGNSWAGSEGTGSEKSMQIKYFTNTATDAVRVWNITFTALTYSNNDVTTNIPVSTTTYAAGTLYKTVTIDEHNNATVEYKDLEGHVVLKKVQAGTIAPDYSGTTGFLSTYYIYDDLGQLRYVIQPKAVALLLTAGNWSLSPNIINELSFRYEYDARQRMSAKKAPGVAWVYMIYDQRDRLVFTQDGNTRLNQQWLGTLYDALNRPVETGILTYAGSAAALQNYVTSNTGNGTPYTQTTTGITSSAILPDLYVNNRQQGQQLYQASNSITIDNSFTSEEGAYFIAEIDPSTSGTITNTATITDNPIPTGSALIPLTLTNYDDYSNTSKSYISTNNGKLDKGTNLNTADPLPPSASSMTKGLATSFKVRVLENANDLTQGMWLETANFYDDKGRVVQTQADNYKGGKDVLTMMYSFTGQVVCNYLVHNNTSGGISNLRIKTNMNYDFAGRLITVTKNINDDASTANLATTQRTIATYTYDALGKLKQKKTGQKTATGLTPSSTPMEDDNYAYNIRGWLKGTNWNYPTAGPTSSTVNNANNKWFGMDLSYDWGFTSNQYNGNIAGERWMSAGDGAERSYGFGYDPANRLLFADFKQNFSNTWANTDPANSNFTINYKVIMGDGATGASAYDENGNILKMQQYGLVLNASQPLDNLSYTYENSGVSNKLRAVSDLVGVQPGATLGDFNDKNTGADDYGYDVNGNLITDLNKRLNGSTGTDITSGGAITYNHLNLPWQILVKNDDGSSKGSVTYIYDAAGNKLEKRTTENASVANNNTAKQTATTYLGGFVYENSVLQFFSQEEGRIRPVTPNSYNNNQPYAYDYFLKDNLGNTRTVLTDQLQQDIYPAATVEDGASTTESTYYTINTNDIAPNPASLSTAYQNNNGNPPYNNNPSSNTTANSAKMYRLNGNTGDKTGLGITLKVMTGDVVDIFGKSFWHSTGVNPSNTYTINSAITSFINAFAGTLGAAGSVHGATASALNSSGATTNGLTTWMNSVPTPASVSIPKAYINWILFDEQFKPVTSGGASSYDLVNTLPDAVKNHHNTVPISKGGYLYVYCSNESNIDVFFDNLQVIHMRGALLEETHYYPFGLVQAGISSKAASFGSPENKRKYNAGSELQNQEFSDGSGLEMYATSLRSLDPQLGRWWQVDPKPDYAQSLYSAMNNNPISFNDPLGDTVRHSFRTGFLGIFGKKVTVDYDNGKYYNAGTNTEYTGKTRSYQKALLGDLTTLSNNSATSSMMGDLVSSTQVVQIKNGGSSENGGASFEAASAVANPGQPLVVNYSVGKSYSSNDINQGGASAKIPGLVALAHEFAHVEDYLTNGSTNFLARNGWYTSSIIPGRVIGRTEIFATDLENRLRANLGLPLREFYGVDKAAGLYEGRILNGGTRTNANINFINGGTDAAGNLIPVTY